MRAGIAHALARGHGRWPLRPSGGGAHPLTQQLLEVPTELVETVLSLELQKDAVIADDLEGRRCVFLAGLYRAEREIAEKLKVLDIGKPPRPSIDNGIDPPRPNARNTRPSIPLTTRTTRCCGVTGSTPG